MLLNPMAIESGAQKMTFFLEKNETIWLSTEEHSSLEMKSHEDFLLQHQFRAPSVV